MTKQTNKANAEPKVTEPKPAPAGETASVASQAEPLPPAQTSSTPAIIVFGVDQTDRRVAAWFPADQAELASKAAELMKLRVIKVAGTELTGLATQLSPGRIYASGLAFVSPIRPSLYDWIADLADPKPAPNLPANWDAIDVGHLVLVQESLSSGWYEAIVIAKNNDMLTIKFRDYPKDPPLVRHRSTIALMKPTAAVNA